MQAEDSWPSRNFLTKNFSEIFPMVRFEPGTFHSASERLNHSAIPETVCPVFSINHKFLWFVTWDPNWKELTAHLFYIVITTTKM